MRELNESARESVEIMQVARVHAHLSFSSTAAVLLPRAALIA